MTNSLGTWATLLCTLMFLDTVASAVPPLDLLEVVTVTPSRVINHEVDLKGPFDDDVIETPLTGPQFFSHSVGFKHKAVQDLRAYLNWYKIVQPAKEPQRTFSVRDPLRDSNEHSVKIESSAFLLSPAQRLTTGSPSAVPDGLNYFKAYRIVDAPLISKKVKLAGTLGPEDRTATRAIFLCMPVEQWHHHEHFPIRNVQDWLIVYELVPHKHSVDITTIDQFGLNKLEVHSSNWLCLQVKATKEINTE
jgi:hypothetical protein